MQGKSLLLQEAALVAYIDEAPRESNHVVQVTLSLDLRPKFLNLYVKYLQK